MLKLRLKNNKHSAVWLVEPKVSIGTEPTNGFVVTDPSVKAHHAEVLVKHEVLTLVNLVEDKALSINGKEVANNSPLKITDVFTVGDVEIEVVDPKLEKRAEKKSAPPVNSATGWALKSNHAALANRVFTIKPKTIVGRSNECDITLAAAHLSRRHAELTVKNGLLYVKDLGSANGTLLNGTPVTEARVKRGDEIRFDTLSFGVIGPSEDLDKTTIRPAVMANKPASKSANQKATSQTKEGAKAVAGAPVKVTRSSPPQNNSVSVNSANNNPDSDAAVQNQNPFGTAATEKSKGKSLLWFILLGLVAVGVALAYSMGIFE